MTVKEITARILAGIDQAIDRVKDTILELAKTSLENTEKKAQLDATIIAFVINRVVKPINFRGMDILIDKGVSKLLSLIIPKITQKIFDLMKAQFDELSKKV